jgi:predicted nucleotidyltransferase
MSSFVTPIIDNMVNPGQMDIITSFLLKYSPKKIGLFGSGARGDEHDKSDLDILMSFPNNGNSPYSLLELLSLERALEHELGFPVEIVNEKNVKNKILKEQIDNDLFIIYEQV